MSQIINPAQDANNPGLWVTQDGLSADLFERISSDDAGIGGDEDTSWIWPPPSPSASVYVTKLEQFVRPPEAEEWTINVRMQKALSVATQLDLLVQLRQYYIDEIDQGDLVYEETIVDVAFGLQDYVLTIPGLDPSTISTSELYIRMEADTI